MYEMPWPKPALANCVFYHSMYLPQTGPVEGQWDIRPDFEAYTGGLDLRGKRVLDVGTCTGAIAFEMDNRGADVTAFDADSVARFQWVPFASTLYHQDRARWNAASEQGLIAYKSAFWYAWHEYESRVKVVYGDVGQLAQLVPEQDVVLACAIIEHLSDPVTAIGQIARVAKEAVVIGFTHVDFTPGLFMRPHQEWSANHPYVWWRLSADLYRLIFRQLGFEVEFVEAYAMFGTVKAERHTIVARRVVAA
ncbi:class I SAM-dependent methyltransferase [Sediminicoccus sp. KRV36]|uniref:class I SAM-dependent methyltransferase n=1 Tax=Sediminicoccus sp. KRV36 TaxID=3133721 RepID=UPI0020107C79|nr:class I SAM-dependent methyltransferase [Sediminicoccus rosea]UPY35710.1 methyltransferase domain-containing protein [Sediminicoccus rosea]